MGREPAHLKHCNGHIGILFDDMGRFRPSCVTAVIAIERAIMAHGTPFGID
jgi:hypothetical protein